MHLIGVAVPVAPLPVVLHSNLNSLRPAGLTHIKTLDEAGLITPLLEFVSPDDLQKRLAQARKIIAEGKPGVEN